MAITAVLHPFFIMWPYEHNENHIDNSAQYCEMCGADLSDGVPNRPNASREAEALSVIAHMYVEDPLATGVLLRKIVNPSASYAEIAKVEGFDKAHIVRKLSKISKQFPDLFGILGFNSRASRSQANVKNNGPSSAYRGVTWHSQRQRWQAQIVIAGKPVYCGLFDDEIAAARAYNVTAVQLLGGRAVLNVIS